MTGKVPLEVAVFSGRNAIKAQHAGAHRVELNAPGSYAAGGLTPPVQELTSIAAELEIPIRIMIRPVGQPLETTEAAGQSDFVYSPAEFNQMQESIRAFKATGVMNPVRGDGFVFGILKPVSEAQTASAAASITDTNSVSSYAGPFVVDKERCAILTELARPYPCVFHRAFDPIAATDNMYKGLRDLMDCFFDGILTSGGPGPHGGHIENLTSIIEHLSGRLQVIVGGGVRSKNVAKAVAPLGIYEDNYVWMHSACLTQSSSKDKEHEGVEMVDGVELRDLLGEIQTTKRA